MNQIQRIGNFYTRTIMKNIGIFLFIGLVSVIFHENGWFPNKPMYDLSQFAYRYAAPFLIAGEGGILIGGGQGGVLSVLGVCGFIAADPELGIFGAMLCGPLGGWVWSRLEGLFKRGIPSSLQMLFKNLLLGVCGLGMASAGYYIAAPVIQAASEMLFHGLGYLLEYRLTGFLSILIEPAKVFFLNNLMNHGVLVPLGLSQASESGSSVLFLLESNPGPGFGVLLALLCCKKTGRGKKEQSEYISAMFAEAVGGIHEVYFPFVLSDLRLLIPLILGGVTGSFWFEWMNCGLQGAVSPGSVLIITILAGKSGGAVLLGILLSAAVSFAGSMLLLRVSQTESAGAGAYGTAEEAAYETTCETEEEGERMDPKGRTDLSEVKSIAFVCDGGMGSSAMGAALFRRVLRTRQIEGIQVEAYASDMIPEGIDLIVCQKEFCQIRTDWQEGRQIYTVDSLVSQAEYEGLADRIAKAGRAVQTDRAV